MIKILVVDDEEPICDILQYNLSKAGYDVDCAYSAEEALGYDLSQYSLIISDIMMDRMSGFDFAKRMKSNAETENVPLIFCSALTGEDETVMGLNIGADDYIPKPFEVGVVLARVNAVLRRSQAQQQQRHNPQRVIAVPSKENTPAGYESDIKFKGMRIDRNDKTCYVDDEAVKLSHTEYDLLMFFLTHRNRIFSRGDILKAVWNDQQVTDRAVDTNLTRLRKKIGQYGSNIVTKAGFGYGFKEEI